MSNDNADLYGMKSPGGFAFGIQGWHWGEPRPTTITFFLDNTCKVCDQHGRAIKGGIHDNKAVLFAANPPTQDDAPGARAVFATHAQVIAYLAADLRIDWKTLTWAGWPQLPYADLKKLPDGMLPPTPIEELRKIKDGALRKDALRIRREVDEMRVKEMQAIEDE